MLRNFVIYGSALIVLYAGANFNGYVFTSMLNKAQKADKAANHYHK